MEELHQIHCGKWLVLRRASNYGHDAKLELAAVVFQSISEGSDFKYEP